MLQKDKLVKLNVGCGQRKMHGFINIDAREDVEPDMVANVAKIHEKFSDADLLYACHVLEHFPLKLGQLFSQSLGDRC